ncbi:hypothetical protein [Oerskovia flava]|uniref:hypothetical protein n=1 Tax=Oerskovia flava TaxID=2986422 RepID=UPI00223EEA60|nr:hypothetical protein [Oerskovia sp. JB1-3-2]
MASPNAGSPDDAPDVPGEPGPDPSPSASEEPGPDASGPGAGGPDASGPGAGGPDQPRDAEPPDVEARWADIVAELADLDRAPVDEPEQGAGPARGADFGTGRTYPVAPWVRTSGPRDWPTTPEVEDLDEADSHFEPPDPPLVLGRDPLATMAWGVAVGVPVLLLLALVLLRPFPVIAGQVGGVLFVAAVAVLVWRMPHHRDEDPGPGAVV